MASNELGLIPYEELEKDYYDTLMDAKSYKRFIILGTPQIRGYRNMRETVLMGVKIMTTILQEIERRGMSTESFPKFKAEEEKWPEETFSDQ